jgi:NAD(P)-dependent dehydrogenase (short-subunit alcohol dehydrogenase family)
MNKEIENQLAVVIGGASGIGAATETLLKAEGARVVTWDVAVSADIQCDILHEQSIDSALRATIDKHGAPTLLVVAAGLLDGGTVLTTDSATWDRSLGVNLRGPFLCVKAFAKEMIARQLKGAMVLVGSISGIFADPGIAAYSIGKAGVVHLARIAARELGEFGIRVNAVCPGPTDTPMMAQVLAAEGVRGSIKSMTPLGRVGQPDDVAEAIVGVLSMRWVTGQVLSADGGTSLVTPRGMATLGNR